MSVKHSVAQRFQQTGGVADRHRTGRPRTDRMDRFITLMHLRHRFRTATTFARQYGISRQCCAASGKPGNLYGQGSPMWDKSLQHVIGLPVCSGHSAISVGGDSHGLRFYSLCLGLTLVIMTVEFKFLEE